MIYLLKHVKILTIFEFIIQLNYINYTNKQNNKHLKFTHYEQELFRKREEDN